MRPIASTTDQHHFANRQRHFPGQDTSLRGLAGSVHMFFDLIDPFDQDFAFFAIDVEDLPTNAFIIAGDHFD